MPTISLTVNVHIPLLRITEESIPFLDGTLWQMPFETFNYLTAGAFEDQKAAYIRTQPVFFNIDLPAAAEPWMLDASLACNHVLEHKLPSNAATLADANPNGITENLYRHIHTTVAEKVWSALLLAAPDAQLIQPIHSITFISSKEGVYYFSLDAQKTTNDANVRGDADAEYLFMHEACAQPLPPAQVQEATQYFSLIQTIEHSPELNNTLTSLQSTCLPYLSEKEKFTLCMAALEQLLVPEVYREIRANFAHRVATLLYSLPGSYANFYALASQLYKRRSQALHGQALSAVAFSSAAEAQKILAALVVQLAARVAEGATLDTLLQQAAGSPIVPPENGTTAHAHTYLNHAEAKHLYAQLKITSTLSSHANTATDRETLLVHWSPLIGLAAEAEGMVQPLAAFFTSLSTDDIISLEDKNIRRDFIGSLRTSCASTAAIGLVQTWPNEEAANEPSLWLPVLEKKRNLLVVALRLYGYKQFIDPALLGIYMYRKNLRYRKASVLRQSILLEMRKTPKEVITIQDREPLLLQCKLIEQYFTQVHSAEADHMLNLYRIVHEHRYMPVGTRMGVAFTLLEKMLGGFRPKAETVQLEDLVATAVGDTEATHWFRQNGRTTRNQVAHGYWQPASQRPDFIHMVAVLDGLLPVFINSLLVHHDPAAQKPKDVLIPYITK